MGKAIIVKGADFSANACGEFNPWLMGVAPSTPVRNSQAGDVWYYMSADKNALLQQYGFSQIIAKFGSYGGSDWDESSSTFELAFGYCDEGNEATTKVILGTINIKSSEPKYLGQRYYIPEGKRFWMHITRQIEYAIANQDGADIIEVFSQYSESEIGELSNSSMKRWIDFK